MTQLDLKQAKKAVSALYKFQANNDNNNELLEEESDNAIIIQLSTHTIKNVTPKTKQKKINLKHSPYSNDLEICLITKSNPSEIEELIKKQNVPYIKKVITPLLLKTTYKTYESKRKLASSYDLFLADDRISHLVPELVGTSFLKKNKVPVAVKMSGSLKDNVNKVLKSTYAKASAGTVCTIKIGHFGMKQSEIVDNYEVAVPQLVAHAARDWSFVNIIGLKSKKSPLLPIICNLPQGKEEKKEKEEEKEEKKEEKKEVKKGAKAVTKGKVTKQKTAKKAVKKTK